MFSGHGPKISSFKMFNWLIVSFVEHIKPLSFRRPTKNNLAKEEAYQIKDMVVDWCTYRATERFHIQFFDRPSIVTKENLKDTNILMITKMLQLAIRKDTQTQLLKAILAIVILANKLVVLEKKFKVATRDCVDDIEVESLITFDPDTV